MSCQLVSLLTIMLIITEFSYGQREQKFFRKDYRYLEGPRSFYKIHTIPQTWESAKKVCEHEGAKLFYPVDESEANDVIAFWNATKPQDWIFIGVSARFAKGIFVTIEGIPISDVYCKWAPWAPQNAEDGRDICVVTHKNTGLLHEEYCSKKLPFICKKTLASLEWNQKCSIPDMGYFYIDELSKCHKFHLTPMTWREAYSVCSREQSYLAIINSQKEAEYFANITAAALKDLAVSTVVSNLARAVHLGFQNLNGEGWSTIKGTSLQESGYAWWGTLQPDGGENERCGSMFYDGSLNDIGCNQKCFFICEHDSQNLLDERFGIFNK